MSKSDAAKPEVWKMLPGVYDTNPETASEFPHGPQVVTNWPAEYRVVCELPMYAEDVAAHIASFNPQTAEAMVALMDTLKAAIAADGLPKGWGLVQERLDAALLKLAEPTP